MVSTPVRPRAYRHNPYTWEGIVFLVESEPNWQEEMQMAYAQPQVQETASNNFTPADPGAEPARPQPQPVAVPRTRAKSCKTKFCFHGLSRATQCLCYDVGQAPQQHNRGAKQIKEATKFRTAMCKHATNGHCCLGDLCWMAHSAVQLRTQEQNQNEGILAQEDVDCFILTHLRIREHLDTV